MTATDYMIGYGSILSQYSRETYSGITGPAIKVELPGWRRVWSVRYHDEAATYLGVTASDRHNLEGALVPVQVSPELRHRERGYDFIELNSDDVRPINSDLIQLPDARFWIVVNQEHLKAEAHCPIPQSYVDTCLIGCLETGGHDMLIHFIQTTKLWDGHWINDRNREKKLYPRHTPASPEQIRVIDTALEREGLLGFRIED